MKVIVVSDTHGNSVLLQRAVDFAVENGFEAIWHLGDNYDDIEQVELSGLYFIRVPGIYHPAYRSGVLPAQLTLDIENFTVTLIHDPDDPALFSLSDNRIVFHGHSHRPGAGVSGSTVYVNPGHLKHREDRGYEASFLAVDFEANNCSLTWYSLGYSKMMGKTISLVNNTLQLSEVH